MRPIRFLPLVILLLALVLPWAAQAHAIIVESTPAIDSTVTGPDLAITLRYNSRVDHDRSKITLFPPDGMEQPVAMSPDAPADTLAAAAHGLTPGGWRLRWQVLSVDGHITRGDIPFTVK